jgi:hypothetical protein
MGLCDILVRKGYRSRRLPLDDSPTAQKLNDHFGP